MHQCVFCQGIFDPTTRYCQHCGRTQPEELPDASATSGELRVTSRAPALPPAALSRSLAAQAHLSLLKNQQDRALLLAIKACQEEGNYDACTSLMTALLYSPHLERVVRGPTFLGINGYGVTGLAFGPDYQTLFSSDSPANGPLTIWNLENRTHQFFTTPPFNHALGVDALAVSPDGRVLASAGPNRLNLWDLTTGELQTQVEGDFAERYASLAFSPDGRILAASRCRRHEWTDDGISYCAEGEVALIDGHIGHVIGRPIVIPRRAVLSLAFNADGTRLAVAISSQEDPFSSEGDAQGQILQLDLATQTFIAPPLLGHTGAICAVTFSPDGKRLASASADGTILLWDASTGKPLYPPMIGHTGPVLSLAFSPDSAVLASGGLDKTIRLWDGYTGHALGPPLPGHRSEVCVVAFSRDGRQLASGSGDNAILLWNVVVDTPISRRLKHTHPHRAVFSPDGTLLVSCSGEDGTIIVWDVASAAALTTLTAPEYEGSYASSITNVAFSPDGKTLASLNLLGTIILWETATWTRVGQTFQHHARADARGLAFRADHRTLASSDDRAVAFSPDGGMLAFVSSTALWETTSGASLDQLPVPAKDTVMLWDVHNAALIGVLKSGPVESLAFSPDGGTLATLSNRTGSTVVWNVTTRKPIGKPLVNRPVGGGNAWSVAFSPDGTLLASGGWQTFTLWDVASQQPMAPPFKQFDASHRPNALTSLMFSPDNRLLASADTQGVVLWEVGLAAWQGRAREMANRNFTQDEWEHFSPDEPYPHQICPDLPAHPSVVAALLRKAAQSAEAGDAPEASASFSQATTAVVQQEDPLLCDEVCWRGAVAGFAQEVLPACNQAVQLDPENGAYRDSRGVARAVAGDTEGAISDFQFFVDWARRKGLYTDTVEYLYQAYFETREQWIQALKAGQRPFEEPETVREIAGHKLHYASTWTSPSEEF